MAEKKKVLLDFEKPLAELYLKIDELKTIADTNGIDLSDEVNKMESRAHTLKDKIYNNLTPEQIVKVARHIDRPTFLDYIESIFTDFVELHGDRYFGDDPSIVGGFAKINDIKAMVLGHQRGKDTKDKIFRNFGMSQPEGYRKALRLMKLAEKYNLPVITFVDTQGAFPGLEAEERGQAEAIARNLFEMSGLHVPVISIITGEGGSGGALGIAVANEVLMLEYSIYSVISPEGCASILYRDSAKASEAARALKITAGELKKLKVIDDIIPEPLGGAHNNYNEISDNIKKSLLKSLKKYQKMSRDELCEHRYDRFRALGIFIEGSKNG